MAGSYGHVVDDDGRLLAPQDVNEMLENGGDVYEAVEEMYGMIWWLADQLEDETGEPPADAVERSREHYLDGLRLSPGQVG